MGSLWASYHRFHGGRRQSAAGRYRHQRPARQHLGCSNRQALREGQRLVSAGCIAVLEGESCNADDEVGRAHGGQHSAVCQLRRHARLVACHGQGHVGGAAVAGPIGRHCAYATQFAQIQQLPDGRVTEPVSGIHPAQR